jgi:hypothetical protein
VLLLTFVYRDGICDSAASAASLSISNSYDWFVHPPAWITWLSLVGGVSAFVWRLWEFEVSRFDRGNDQRIACDAFWYESIIVPRIVEPLLDFLSQQHEKQQLLANDSSTDVNRFTNFNRQFQEAYSQIASRIRVLQVISQSTHSEIMKRLDELEDAVTVHCFDASSANCAKINRRTSPDLSSHFSDTLSYCIKQFKDLHFQLRHPS